VRKPVWVAGILDTRTLAPKERADAIDAAMRYATVPNEVTLDDSHAAIEARIDLWDFGPDATLLRQFGSGMRLARGREQLRIAAPERIALSLLSEGCWKYRQHGRDQVIQSERSHLVLTDLSAPHEYERVGMGGAHSFMVDFDRLGLSADMVRSAAPRLEASPLYSLVQDHLRHLARMVDTLNGTERSMVGIATAQLVRALVVGATNAGSGEGDESCLTTRIKIYVGRHLTDVDLTPEQIAAAHHISLRQLYNLWSDSSHTLNRWIIHQRLELARRELSAPRSSSLTLDTLGRRVGFTSASHFSRRFKDAYGVSPREYREFIAPLGVQQ